MNYETFQRNDFDDEERIRERWWKPIPGEIILDIGSAIGSYALPAVCSGAEVYAFSSPNHAVLLKHNLALNPGALARCHVMEHGLYSAQGFLTCDGSHYYFQADDPGDLGEHGLRVMRLDDLGIHNVGMMKIDVEGAEVEVLKGGEQTIRKYTPRVLVENHVFMQADLEKEVIKWFEGLGLGYQHETDPSPAVSHSFFWVPR